MAQAALLATAITDAFMAEASLTALSATLTWLALVLAARAVTAWAQEYVARRCSAAVKSSLRMRLIRRAALPSPGWTDTAKSGEVVILATRGLDALDAYFGRYLPQLALSVLVPVAVIALVATVDLVAAATIGLTVPLIPIFMVLIGSATERRRRRRWNALARLSHHFLDVVAGLPTLRIFGRAEAQVDRLERVTDDYRRESLATLRVAFLSAFALELLATLSVALVAVGIGLRLVDGSLDLRTGLFVLILAPEAYLPLRQLGASFHASEEGLGAAEAAFRIIEAPLGRAGGGAAPVPDLRAAEIRITGLTVRQPGRNMDAPSRVDAAVRAGEVLGLSGPSGSGKTSLLETLLGLRTADEGAVGVMGDGHFTDIRDIDLAAWHRHVAWVPQRPFCFRGTIAENVRLAAPEATDADVATALARVGLGGVDPSSLLGEGGSGVSVGQRRRIGVARALVRKADLLLLDEPTAGLDESSEARVLAAIRDVAREGRAVILVAHRPAALAIADRVVSVSARSRSEERPTAPRAGSPKVPPTAPPTTKPAREPPATRPPAAMPLATPPAGEARP